jgi:hypothetical protein
MRAFYLDIIAQKTKHGLLQSKLARMRYNVPADDFILPKVLEDVPRCIDTPIA